MKKNKIPKGDLTAIHQLVKDSPKVRQIENGTFKTQTLFIKGSICIIRNINNGKDLAGNPFYPEKYYKFENQPIFYDLYKILTKAYQENRHDGLIEAYRKHLANWDKEKTLLSHKSDEEIPEIDETGE